MCVVSMIGDHFDEKWKRVVPNYPSPFGNRSAAEIEELRKEVEELKQLIKKALEYDKKTGQPHCETEDKYERIKKFAAGLGVDLEWEN